MPYIGKEPARTAIDATDIPNNSITAAKIVDGAITIADIADDAVTEDKLANAINTAIAANTAKTGITGGQASAITANTAKITNATHTGDVTGATALTIAAGAVDIAHLSATGTAGATNFLRGDNSWQVVAIPKLDAPTITGTLSVNASGNVTHTISNWSDDVSYTITPTNCTVGSVNASGQFVVTHTSGIPSYTIVATTASLGLDDSITVTKNILLNLTAPTISAPADSATLTNVVYTITSTDTNDDKIILDIGSSNFNFSSVSVGSGSKVGNTVEVTGFTTNNPAVTIQFTAEATYSVTAKSVNIAGTYGTSDSSSADSLLINNNTVPTNPTNAVEAELTTNGTFDSNTTGWSGDSGGTLTWVSGGTVTVGSGGGDSTWAITQTSLLTSGKQYKITFRYRPNNSSGTMRIRAGGSSVQFGTTVFTANSWNIAEAVVTADGTTLEVGNTGGSMSSFDIDYISVKNVCFPTVLGDEVTPYLFTFSGATDPDVGDSVTHYKVDTFTGAKISCSTAEVAAGTAHSFAIASTASDTACSFRVRAKDSNNEYSSGVTVNCTVKDSKLSTLQTLGDSSCRACYKFDSSTNDVGGSYNLSWASGSAAWNTTSARYNASAVFNGTNTYLTQSGLSFQNTWTFSFWMKTANNTGMMFFARTVGSYGHRVISIETSRIKVYEATTDQYTYWTAPGINQWNHYVCARNGSNLKIYINNTLVGQRTDTLSVNASNSGLMVGISNNADSGITGGQWYPGELDQVRIFDKQVSASEVSTLYNEV